MIREKIRQELLGLFPPLEAAASAAPPTEQGREAGGKKAKKDEPRANGVIERDYRIHGYHIDAQVAADQIRDQKRASRERMHELDAEQFFTWRSTMGPRR